MPRGGNTELSASTQANKAKPSAAATATRQAAHIKARRAFDGASDGDWKNSDVYWASMNGYGYFK